MPQSKRINRREFLRLSAAVGAGLVATSCVPSTAPTAVPPTSAPAAPAATAVPAPTAVPAAAEPTPMSVAHWWGDLWMKGGGTVLEQKKNLKIDSQSIPVQEYSNKITTMLAGGVAPDVIQMDATWRGPFFVNGVFEPFDDALKASKIDMTKWWWDPAKEDGYKGKTMGVEQFAMQSNILHVNKDITDALGLKLPEWGTPEFDTWKWDDFVKFCQATAKVQANGTVDQFAVDLNYTDFFGVLDYNVFQFGGQTLDDGVLNFEEKECLLNTPEAAAGFQAIVDLVLKYKVAPSIEGRAAIEGGAYRAGKAASTFFWSTSEYYGDMTFKQTYLAFPFQTRRIQMIGGNSLHVNKDSKIKDIALDAMIFHTTDKEDRVEFMNAVGTAPAYDPLPSVATMADSPAKTTLLIGLSRIKGMSECSQCVENSVMVPRWKGGKSKFIEDTETSALQAMLTGQPVQATLDDAVAKINAELKVA